MVILLRAPLARPTAIERLVKNGESRIVYLNQLPLHAIESLPVSDHTKPTDLLFPHLAPEWVSVAFVRLCRGRHRGYSLSRPQAYCRKLAPHEGGRHPYRRAIARHKDFRMAARYQHLSPGFLADAVGTLDGKVLQEDFLP